MNINGKPINGEHFAFDGCHKIYICESVEDELDAKDMGYTLYPIEELQAAYGNSCPLRFISNWGLDRNFVSQFEEASFGDDEPPEQDPEPRYRARKDYTLDELVLGLHPQIFFCFLPCVALLVKHWSDDT